MRFTKMHGLGNDYVVLGFRESPSLKIECEGSDSPVKLDMDFSGLSKRLCNRYFGIGADGLIAVMPSDIYDFRMRIFNIDGTEAEMCGNGIRCATKYFIENLMDSDRLPAGDEPVTVDVQTMAGKRTVVADVKNGIVGMMTVNMGIPILEPSMIPVDVETVRAVDVPIDINGETFVATCVSMGNPHAVIFLEEDVSEMDISAAGPAIEEHPLFPNKTNVEFTNVNSEKELTMRVWERGVGETLACGTGACATLVAANLTDRTGREAVLHLRGGDLHIEWTGSDEIMMTGPAETVFSGEIEDPLRD
ncbi:MAG TPA: diaminopimelate epimerase [bacterium]|nr:diaminopimelate epimerase [bacterium]